LTQIRHDAIISIFLLTVYGTLLGYELQLFRHSGERKVLVWV